MPTTPPSKSEITVATDALRRAGTVWDQQAGPLRTAANIAGGYANLSPTEMGLALPLWSAYSAICVGAAGVLHEAATRVAEVGDALVSSANTYQTEENENVHQIQGIW